MMPAAMTMVMGAVALLQRLQRLLGTRDTIVLQRLPNLVQGLRQRRVSARSLALALELLQLRIGLLGTRKIAGLNLLSQLAEGLQKLILLRRRLIAICR